MTVLYNSCVDVNSDPSVISIKRIVQNKHSLSSTQALIGMLNGFMHPC